MPDSFSKLTIVGWRQFKAVELELHPRLTIITGANGAGKSTLLNIFIRHFGYNKAFLATPTTKKNGKVSFTLGLFRAINEFLLLSELFGIEDTSEKSTSDDPVQIGKIEYSSGATSILRVPGKGSLFYDIEVVNRQPVVGVHIDSHRAPNIYREVSMLSALPPDANDIGNSVNGEYQQFFNSGQTSRGSLHHIKSTLIAMSIYGRGNADMEPIPKLVELFEGFEKTLRELLPRSLGFKKLMVRSPEVLLSTETGDFIVDAASGGVIKLIEIAWQLYFFSCQHGNFVVTMDEPENHLHPSMQKAFLPSILNAFPNIQIIVATHSPFIISAIRDSNVYVLRYEKSGLRSKEDDDESIQGLSGSRVVAEKLDTINKAGTASEILRDVLGITSTMPDWAETRVREIIESRRGKTLSERDLDELFMQLGEEGLASSYPTALTSLTSKQ